MDDLDRREAFLLAIFANPDDDLPRLVFADYLDERGEHDWAELIRVQCEIARTEPPIGVDCPTTLDQLREREQQLISDHPRYGETDPECSPPFPIRGFVKFSKISVTVDLLADPIEFRRTALFDCPDWYDSNTLIASGGLIASSKPINTILTSPVTQKVTWLDLAGGVVETTPSIWDEDGGEHELSPTDFTYRPVVTLQAVEALVNARECQRITHLDLRNNDLDNDAARVILRSTNLIRLQSLHLFDGNRLRGRTWAQLQERFGEDVVQ